MATVGWASLLKSILDAGTWTDFRALDGVMANPPVRLGRFSRRTKKTRILLPSETATETPVQSIHGGVIQTKKEGELEAICTKIAHREAIHDDIIRIMNAGSYSWTVKKVKRFARQKNLFILNMTIKILN